MYTATARFGPGLVASWGGSWEDYVAWSGLTQLSEVVTLDGMLCRQVIDEISDEDWKHNVHEDYLINFFWDLDYLIERVREFPAVQILAAVRNPSADRAHVLDDERFDFQGYDLVDRKGGVSALSNCGGFPLAFENHEISAVGLINSFIRANEVRTSLREQYPNHSHSDCDVWALWRMASLG